MKCIKNIFILLGFLFISISFLGCEKKELVIQFDNEYPLALAPDVEWAVVRDPYAAYKSDPGWAASVIGHCRRGEIFQVMGKNYDINGEKWYFFEDGWLPESCINVYSNRYKAERVSKILLKSDAQNLNKQAD